MRVSTSGVFLLICFTNTFQASAETRRRVNDEDQEPMYLERRFIGVGGDLGSPADTSFANASFTHPTFTNIGVKLREFNNTVGNLQQLGVSHVAELPELVLVGDQSAGKSSLMSGLARVSLPCSAGVGTRCPLHIRLIDSPNGHWSCTVALQLDYDFEPKGKIKKSDVTATNPFPPWTKKSHRDNKIFKTIFEPGEIEEVLRWAQVAILNPKTDHELFIPGEGAIAKTADLDGKFEVSFVYLFALWLAKSAPKQIQLCTRPKIFQLWFDLVLAPLLLYRHFSPIISKSPLEASPIN